MPSKSEWRQRPASPHTLSTRRWALQPRAQEKKTLWPASTVHLRGEESEHEHEHTSKSEDDLLKLLGMPNDKQTWTRFDKRATNLSHHEILGSFVGNTTDGKPAPITILEYTKHMNRKSVYRKLPSVRDIRTMLLHCSPVTRDLQLKQSFHTFAALPADETRHLTSQTQPVLKDDMSEAPIVQV